MDETFSVKAKPTAATVVSSSPSVKTTDWLDDADDWGDEDEEDMNCVTDHIGDENGNSGGNLNEKTLNKNLERLSLQATSDVDTAAVANATLTTPSPGTTFSS